MRQLDGLRPVSQEPARPPAKIATLPARRKTSWGKLALVVLAIVAVSVSVWAQPLLAGLPFATWPDRLALARFAKPGRYLVLFQNPRELRPTGGFLGSFAEVELGWGFQIKKIQVETNIYTRDAQYAKGLGLETPEPLKAFLGDQPWAMRDSNWALSFPEAAETIRWFYDHEGGQPVDAVIALDARLLERVLRTTGSVILPKYDTILTADNVIGELQKEIEQDYWQDAAQIQENEPKRVLADLLPAMVDRLKGVDRLTLVELVTNAFAAKEIMIAADEPRLVQSLHHANWDGALAETQGDYLYVNEANLTPVDGRERVVGAKSSWSLARTYHLDRAPTSGVSSVHRLTLTRDHQGQAIWPDGPNHSYLRVAVPQGSTIVGALRGEADVTAEVRLSQEAGKTVFGFWSRLAPGENETITLIYEVPRPFNDALVLERQPGLPVVPVTVFDEATERWHGDLDKDLKV